ncbi:MAG: hypothetical protein HWN65_16900 [Candidatus Helarchaeota archaeon]|nr:hypothetical protein [Candidatus Helarchaeota archaeon]
MASTESQTQEMGRIKVRITKGSVLSSLLIVLVFIGINCLGYVLNVLNEFVLFVLFSMYFIVNIIIILFSNRLDTVPIEKWGKTFRKYSHLAGGLVALLFALFGIIQLGWICFSILMAFLIHEYFYVRKNIYGMYTKTLIFVGRLDRRYDPNSQENPKPFYPTMWLLAALSIFGLIVYIHALYIVAILDVAVLAVIGAVVAFTFGDSLSTMVGEQFGKHKLPYNKIKSIEGTLAFFGITFVGIIIVLIIGGQFNWIVALIAALVGSISESIIPTNHWLDDNFVVPVSVAVVLYLGLLLI